MAELYAGTYNKVVYRQTYDRREYRSPFSLTPRYYSTLFHELSHSTGAASRLSMLAGLFSQSIEFTADNLDEVARKCIKAGLRCALV